jgi:hypothetical protein
MQNNQQLNEGLRSKDLENMIKPLLTIDTFRSKMGEDRDVCVVSVVAKDRNPAKDLMEFIEKGYNFVLDSDVASGENTDGEYVVFIELARTPELAEQIRELTYGIKKLTGMNEFKFKYHKKEGVHDLTEESLKSVIPATPSMYDSFLNNVKTEEVKKFFSKTLMDDLKLDKDIITIYKPFDKVLKFKIVDESDSVLENIEGPVSIDDKSMSEIFWLTKVLGDYGINKVDQNFVLHNGKQTMLLQRIEQ